MDKQTQTEKYQVVDGQTGYIVGTYTNRKRARAKRDKMDLIYGAVRYRIETINS